MFDIIVITAPQFIPKETEIINSLFRAGLTRLHLRKPNATCSQIEELIEDIDERYYDRIVLHDHHELAIKYQLAGIHLNGRNPIAPKGYSSTNGSISCSCHSLKEIEEKKDECSYMSLSPIFNSISKQGYISNFSTSQLVKAKGDGIIDDSVYALGGVDDKNISRLITLGFAGAMILGYIWQDDGKTALQHFIQLREQVRFSI